MINKGIMPKGFRIESLRVEENNIKGILVSVIEKSTCPVCKQESKRVQSQYQRTVAELPWSGIGVELSLQVRRFFCDNKNCIRKIFTERLPELVKVYGRKTISLERTLKVLAKAEGGESGARTAKELGIKVSADTLLNHIRKNTIMQDISVRVLGVDDWAKKKGQVYGTILVDLETGKIIDLLEDREAETFAKWLKEHPEVEIISRDRGQQYIQGGQLGAPQAIHIADRFHLLQNIRETMERALLSNYQELNLTARELALEQEQQIEKVSVTSNNTVEVSSKTVDERKGQEEKKIQSEVSDKSAIKRELRLERYKKVIELENEGISLSKISRMTGLSRKTVRKYIIRGEFPEIAKTKRSSKLDPYIEYLWQRFQQGFTNATYLFKEIKKLGFTGSVEILRRAIKDWRKGVKEIEQRTKTILVPSTRKLSFALLDLLKDKNKKEDKNIDKQLELEKFVDRLCKVSVKISQARELCKEFIGIIRERKALDLDNWVSKAINSGIVALKNFASFLLKDLDAVRNALIFEWSNGKVEAQVNRLKTVKRQMYGRANLDLLKARLLSINL